MGSGFGFLVLVGLLGLSALVHGADSCVVLQYHHFSEHTPAATSVTPAQFDAHLEFLAQNDFSILPLGEVVAALTDGRSLPERCVSLSVDDAYVSVYEQAFPRVRARGWPMTVFVSTRPVDEQTPAYLNWDQLREMAVAGVELGNHSHSHAHLLRLEAGETSEHWQQRVQEDIQTAQRRIRQETGKEAKLFAYPFGEYRPALAAMVRSLGLAGFGQQSGPVSPDADFSALPRFPMAADYAAMPGFQVKVQTLPMPLAQALPSDPLVPLNEWRPALTLAFRQGDYRFDELRCYVNGSAEVTLTWRDGGRRVLQVVPDKPLQVGRNRYNCTMPAKDSNRYYWYSHNWIRRRADGGWYQE